MILIATYKLKPFLTNDETKQLMDVFAREGAGPVRGPAQPSTTWLPTVATAW